MSRTIQAVYEDGVIKPLETLELKEHEKISIVLEVTKSVAKATSGMIKGVNESTIDEIALSPNFLPEEA